MVTPRQVAQLKQNKPSLIVADLAALMGPSANGDAEHLVYEALLSRGVFKWMAVRRRLITLKEQLRENVTASLRSQATLKRCRKALAKEAHRERRSMALSIARERGYRKAMEEVRAEIHALCHSPRWQAPDNDRKAQRWLNGQNGGQAS